MDVLMYKNEKVMNLGKIDNKFTIFNQELIPEILLDVFKDMNTNNIPPLFQEIDWRLLTIMDYIDKLFEATPGSNELEFWKKEMCSDKLEYIINHPDKNAYWILRS